MRQVVLISTQGSAGVIGPFGDVEAAKAHQRALGLHTWIIGYMIPPVPLGKS